MVFCLMCCEKANMVYETNGLHVNSEMFLKEILLVDMKCTFLKKSMRSNSSLISVVTFRTTNDSRSLQSLKLCNSIFYHNVCVLCVNVTHACHNSAVMSRMGMRGQLSGIVFYFHCQIRGLNSGLQLA